MSTFDSKYVLIHWEAPTATVFLQWRRAAQYAPFRDGLEAGLAQVAEHGARRVVADHSMLNLQEEDEAHFSKQWVPKAAKAGVQRLAVVVPRRQYAQIPKTRLEQRLKSGQLTLHYFDNMDEARLWIQKEAAA